MYELKPNKYYSWVHFILTMILLFVTPRVCASTTSGGGNNPWDPGLTQIQNMLTGDIAHFIIIFAIAASGFAFIKGDQTGLMQKAIAVVLGGSIVVGAVSLYQTLSLGGAII